MNVVGTLAVKIYSDSATDIYIRVLAHLLDRIRASTVYLNPFLHVCFEELFPNDTYAALLANLPASNCYSTGPRDPKGRHIVRTFHNLTTSSMQRFPLDCRELWRGVTAALTDLKLKRCLYEKLAPDLIHRYGIEASKVPDLAGLPRPTLYREVEGYEMPSHIDSLKKVVTMHLYLPADLSQIHLGTALYQRKPTPLLKGNWKSNFWLAKQFEFRPNSGYAFVVNDSISRQSWHGRERLPTGSGVRNTLLNTFYSESRHGYSGYLSQGSD